jgi:hypothetical protein
MERSIGQLAMKLGFSKGYVRQELKRAGIKPVSGEGVRPVLYDRDSALKVFEGREKLRKAHWGPAT